MVRITYQLQQLLEARIKEIDVLVERKRHERAELVRTLKAVKPQNGKLRKGMPEEAKRRIAAAQRERWAKFRRERNGRSVHAITKGRGKVARQQLQAA